MRLRLALTLVVAALAAPAAHAAPPVPPLDEVFDNLGKPEVRDYCVWEVDEDGTRRQVVCPPSGPLPAPEWTIILPRT